MATYDFSRLSSLDFEELVRDLLGAEWRTRLEAFGPGPDRGIDLRHIAYGETTVVQCKHFQGSGFSRLLSHMKRLERPKIEALAPQRYVLVTSVRLTPDNKDALIEALSPYVRSTADIIGATEVEGLLRDHPSVETANYKLWLTSTAVLERVLNSAERCQTEFRIDVIQQKLPLFVQNNAYPRAQKILEESRLVVIAGQPGIGKSTLAEMLIYAHLEGGYEPVIIHADIGEARKLYRSDRRQLFYFDDFLGQTYLGDRPEYLGRNQDSSLADFIAMIQASPRGRFILTTREHILGGALLHSERLAQSGLSDHRCVIELGDYKRVQKARILYNHLYFSDLPEAYRLAILADDFFLEVIDHDNFNPRIIEWLSSFRRVRRVAAADYRAHVADILDRPEQIWSHAFERQISPAARNLLLAVYSAGFGDYLLDLEPTWQALHAHCSKRYNFSTKPTDFRTGLKELDGAFLTISGSRVSFLNPSVRDFLAAVFADSADRVRDIVESAVRFRQISALWRSGETDRWSAIRSHLLADPGILFACLERLFYTPTTRWDRDGNRFVGIPIDEPIEGRVIMAAEIVERLQTAEALRLMRFACDALFFSWSNASWAGPATALGVVRQILKSPWLLAHGGEAVVTRILREIIQHAEDARSYDWLTLFGSLRDESFWPAELKQSAEASFAVYRDSGLDDERYDSSSISEAESLKENLENLRDRFGHDFTMEIAALEEKIAELAEEPTDHQTPAPKAPLDNLELPADDDELRGMFFTLNA